MHFKNTTVRFRNNKPYLLKKVLVTIAVLGFFTYMFISLNWLTSLILFLFIGLPIIFKIRKQPSEGKGFFGKVKNFYKNMYKDYVIDTVPIDFTCNEDEITLDLHRAEIVKSKPALETFNIKKSNIAGIMFDDTDEDILIMFQEANISIFDENTKKELRTVIQQDSTVCFSIKENPDIINVLKDNGYEIELLSEIENEEEETEDPELVAKQSESDPVNENIGKNEIISDDSTIENITTEEIVKDKQNDNITKEN